MSVHFGFNSWGHVGSTWIGHGDGDRVLAVCCVAASVSWGVGLGGRGS